MKLISIIIATYNADATLQRCLNSIIPQKTNDIELIIIDGGSKDHTVDIIRNCRFIDKYISEKDEGIYDAWNKGIRLSSGEWILFLGADDQLCSNCISKQLNYIESYPTDHLDIILAMAWLCDRQGHILRSMGKPYRWSHFRWQMNISHGSSLHNRKLFNELGGFDINFKICGDYEFLLRRPLHSAFINDHLIKMTEGGASTTFKARKEAFLARKKNESIPNVVNHLVYCREYFGFRIKHLFGK